jgi:hypothetical protein
MFNYTENGIPDLIIDSIPSIDTHSKHTNLLKDFFSQFKVDYNITISNTFPTTIKIIKNDNKPSMD